MKERKGYIEDIREIMAPLVSLILLISALYVILSQAFEPENQKWAYGIIETMVGYWINPA